MEETLLQYFKLFSDANRIRMAAMMIEGPCTVEEMTARLQIKPADLPRQLAQFESLGLLRQENGRYRLDTKALERVSRETLAGLRPAVAAQSNDADADDFDRKVVKNFSLPDGRLRELPSQEKKLLPILRHVAQSFEPGTRYTEKQVNEILKRYFADVASLRRYLIDFKVIQREPNGASYWR